MMTSEPHCFSVRLGGSPPQYVSSSATTTTLEIRPTSTLLVVDILVNQSAFLSGRMLACLIVDHLLCLCQVCRYAAPSTY
ncbi:hypothetical protein C8Q80DRAFT_582533 [Daedaleopsis nitida]|nr:hypothetical protein C8Q80DRAFT_582533 [Daedaleopsis nitida]